MRSLSKLLVASVLSLGACVVTPVGSTGPGGPPPPPDEHGHHERSARLAGTVIDTVTHQPVRAGVDIVQVEGHVMLTRARTDDAGRYQTEGVPPGNYLVRIESSGYKLITRSMDLPPGTTQLEITMDH